MSLSETKSAAISETKIEFASHLKLSPEDARLIAQWPSMHRQIAARNENGFETGRILINGASLIGGADNRKPLAVQARISYKTHDNGPASYHVTFMPDAAVLLLAFKIAGKNFGEPAASKTQVVLVEQARWGTNAPKSLEIPGGLLQEGTSQFDTASWETPASGALREFFEESLNSKTQRFLPALDPRQIQSLGSPMRAHATMTDVQHQYALTKTITRGQFKTLKAGLNGAQAGIAADQEQTRVVIMPLDKACQITCDTGQAHTFLALSRYRNKRKHGPA